MHADARVGGAGIPLKPLKMTSAKDFMDAYVLNLVGGASLLRFCLPALTGIPLALLTQFGPASVTLLEQQARTKLARPCSSRQ
jgi:hypothetical protein